jgi:hypothetical protein
MNRNDLGKIAFEEFIRQMGGAFNSTMIANSWDARGEINKEHWRCIAETVVKAATMNELVTPSSNAGNTTAQPVDEITQ